MQINNTLVKTLYGSHLFGLNTPTSDEDYYVIFKESLENIILKKDVECFTTDSNNTQYKELRKFLKDAMSGQTYAIELLFAPSSFEIETSPLWLEIKRHKNKLISQNLRPFLGYAQKQAKKYTGRSENFSELKKIMDIMNEYDSGLTLGEVKGITYSDKVYKKTVILGNGLVDEYIRFFHKEFPLNAKLSIVKGSIQKYLDEYGDRARFYSSKNYDCKAFSHALRLCYMLDELMNTGNITFPVVNRDFLMEVKLGLTPYDEVQSKLDEILQKIDKNINVLPEQPDKLYWDNFILKNYLGR